MVKLANRLGGSLGTVRVLEVPGRVSGRARSTPVSPLRVEAGEFVIAGLPHADWARNAAAAGRGVIVRGRRRRPVRLVEVTDPAVRVEVMRAFPVQVPHGVPFFVTLGLVTGPEPDQFGAAADRVRVFEVLDAG
jgi:hypothetical protein